MTVARDEEYPPTPLAEHSTSGPKVPRRNPQTPMYVTDGCGVAGAIRRRRALCVSRERAPCGSDKCFHDTGSASEFHAATLTGKGFDWASLRPMPAVIDGNRP